MSIKAAMTRTVSRIIEDRNLKVSPNLQNAIRYKVPHISSINTICPKPLDSFLHFPLNKEDVPGLDLL